MTVRKLSFYLLGGLLIILPLIFLWLPSQSGAAGGKNDTPQSPANKLPANYDALAKSSKRSAGDGQLAGQASKPQLAGGRLIQFEPRFDVPTFLWASEQKAANAAHSDNLQEGVDKVAAARSFLSQYASRYRLDRNDVAQAIAASVHDTGKGAIVVKFKQVVGGIEVFRDELNVVMNRDLQLIALTGYLTGDNTVEGLSGESFQLQPEDAMAKAIQDLTGTAIDVSVLRRIEADNSLADNSAANPYIRFTADNSRLQNIVFNDEPSRVKKVMFHLPDGYLPAYYVETRINVPSTDPTVISETPLFTELGYASVVSAADGQILFRHNQVANDTNFSYRVWADPTTKIPFDTPAGNGVHPKLNPVPDGAQYPFVAQNDVTLSSLPFSRNDPWLPAGATETNGNNVDAFVNLFSPDGLGNPVTTTPTDPPTGDFRAQITAPGAFLHTHVGGDVSGSAEARQGSIQQLFYNLNFLHDWFYDAGFDEASGNSQTDNFGRGGLGNDSMKAQAQDFQSFNNANMLTPADGSRPRMRMYNFTSSASNLDIQLPAGIAAKRSIGISQTGTQNFDITSDIVIATFTAGPSTCTITNAAALNGKIAMFDFDNTDGTGCSFSTRITRIHATGALAALMVYTSGAPTLVANITGINSGHTKPVATIAWNSGAPIKTQLAASNTVTARLLRVPNRDGSLDNQIVFHEWGHFISNRLIGNSIGLNTNQSGGLGEGWGDFLGMLLTVRAEDTSVPSNATWNGVYSLATYATSGVPFTGAANHGYYLGIRRAPYSTNFAYNPLTFKHIEDGVALPNTAPIAAGGPNSEVHNTGEIWANMLWECYAALLRDTQGAAPRLTFEEAQGRMKLYLTAAMKITPVSPTFLEARDAVIAAARAYDATDAHLFAQAFAKRGAGTRAVAPDRFSTNNAGVVESFITGGDLAYVGASLDDSVRSCDDDGYLDMGEKGLLKVTLKNNGLEDLTNTTATITSSNPAVTFPNGNTITFPASQTLQNITGSVVVESAAGLSGIQITDFTITFDDPGLAIPGAQTAHHVTRFNVTEVPASTATDTVEAQNTVWTTGFDPALSSFTWQRVQGNATENHVWHGPDPSSPSDQTLVSPLFTVNGSGSLNLQFDHSWDFEFDATANYDGGVVEMRVNGGAWTDIGTPIYNGTLTNYTGNLNPLKARQALVKSSTGTVHSSLTQAIAPGSTVQIRFRVGTDNAAGAGGWNVDNVAFTGVVETPFTTIAADPSGCPAPPVTVVLAFTQAALPRGYVGNSYTATLTPTGGTGPYTYSIVQPFVLPPGLTYSNVGGNLQISGAPTLRGEYPVTFKIADSAAHQTNVSYTLSVVPATQAVGGLIVYGTTPVGQPVKYVPNVLMSATGTLITSASSNSSGAYSLNNLNTDGSYVITPSKTGDVNGVTSFDATLILRHVAAATAVLSGNQLLAADVNNSGSVTTFDATLILRFVSAGIQTANTGETGNWKFTPASRSYSPLSSPSLNDDYTAILIGDVNGDWQATVSASANEADKIVQKRQQKTTSLTPQSNGKELRER